jgi:hypothetical protein
VAHDGIAGRVGPPRCVPHRNSAACHGYVPVVNHNFCFGRQNWTRARVWPNCLMGHHTCTRKSGGPNWPALLLGNGRSKTSNRHAWANAPCRTVWRPSKSKVFFQARFARAESLCTINKSLPSSQKKNLFCTSCRPI